MFECTDKQKLLRFCNRDFVRYRHILHDLNPPCPEWDKAMQRCDYVEGKGFVLRGAQGGRSDNHCDVYFVDSPDRISLVARVRGKAVRLEGEIGNVARTELIDWCRGFAPENVETTHEALKDCLSEIVGTERWRMNGTYTATRESFRERITAHVRRLSP
ncbi:unnamed protein product, partial [marine sediment metagenome]